MEGMLDPDGHGLVMMSPTALSLTIGSRESDLDLGNYERYLGINLTKESNITTGKIYKSVTALPSRLIVLTYPPKGCA